MNVLIISTSPRKNFSASVYFSKILKLWMLGNHVEIISLKTVRDYSLLLERLPKTDALVFATPVYVDSIPSTTLEYLKKLQTDISHKNYNFKVYAITNCGFYEGHQCDLALSTYQLWCKKAKLEWGGGIGIGAGVMLGFIRILPFVAIAITLLELLMHTIILISERTFSLTSLFQGFIPISLIIQTILYILFSLGMFIQIFKLKTSIISKQMHIKSFTTVSCCPRFLFVCLASLYWILRAFLLHGVLFWKLFDKPKENF